MKRKNDKPLKIQETKEFKILKESIISSLNEYKKTHGEILQINITPISEMKRRGRIALFLLNSLCVICFLLGVWVNMNINFLI